MTTKVKICGIKTPDAMTAALEGGADFVGLVFHPTSPRHVDVEVAAYLASYVPAHVKVCGLFVDPDNQKLNDILSNVRLDVIQLHGSETPQRVAEIKQRTGKDIIKAYGVRDLESLTDIRSYESVADWLLLDSPPLTPPLAGGIVIPAESSPRERGDRGGSLPGGSGVAFDWKLLNGFESSRPWMLAGGLTPENVGEAIKLLKPAAVDVSSGVESSRGVKDLAKIHDFIKAVKTS